MNKKMKISIFFLVSLSLALIVQFYFFPYSFPFSLKNGFGKNYKRKKIVVVGGGLAGLSAAISASQNHNSEIIIIDKMPILGGNSAKATSGINGVFSAAQHQQHVEDSYELFSHDTFSSCKGLFDEKIVGVLIEESTSAISFLESFGVDLSVLSQCGGHSAPRTHRAKEDIRGNIGGHIISKLIEAIAGIPNIKVLNTSTVTKIQTWGNSYLVKFADSENIESSLPADDVIVTSGGFAADKEGLVKKIAPELSTFPTTNGPQSQGQGIKILEFLGASIVDMPLIQVHPTGLVDRQNPGAGKVFLAPEALRGSGGLLINSLGERFVNELGFRDDVFNKIQEFGDDLFDVERKVVRLVLNKDAAEKFGISKIKFYASKGFFSKYSGAKNFCEEEDIPYDNLRRSFIEYEKGIKNGVDEFGKVTFPTEYKVNQELFVAYVTPALHYTMGGVKINTKAQVIDKEGRVIPKIYAAGEVTGGIHGKNRLAGNSLLECVVFGRIAGENAGLDR